MVLNSRSKRAFFAFVFILSVVSAWAPEAAQENRESYTVGMCLASGAGMDSQNKAIFTDLVKAFSAKEGLKIQFNYYLKPDEFLADVDKGKLDFALTSHTMVNYAVIKQNKMIPFVSAQVFEHKSVRSCIYVKKDKGFKTVADLRNRRMMTYEAMDAFFSLRRLAGEAPDKVFRLKAGVNAPSMIYAIGLDDTDAIYITDFNVDFFKKTNPGPVKDLVAVGCGEPQKFFPFMKSPKVSETMSMKIREFLMNMSKEESLKKYRPLIKQMKMSFIPTDKSEYQDLLDLIDEGKKNDWQKDYDNWIKYQKLE